MARRQSHCNGLSFDALDRHGDRTARHQRLRSEELWPELVPTRGPDLQRQREQAHVRGADRQ